MTLIDPAGRQAGRGSTAPDGSYRISTPGQGTYTLIAMASAHRPHASAVRVGGEPVASVAVSVGVQPIDVTEGVAAVIAPGQAGSGDEDC